MAKVMYGGGLGLMECLRLRVMDLDFAKSQVYVRGKGGKDRLTTLPPYTHVMEKDIQAVSSPLETL
jgi:site-specific recombinase XerD